MNPLPQSIDHQTLEAYFEPFRSNTLGNDQKIKTQYGEYPLVYADWIAEGRLYGPIEDRMREISPIIANPHSYSSYTGQHITQLYRDARSVIRKHVNAMDHDMLVTTGHGMTGALERFIHIISNRFDLPKLISTGKKPLVLITHMEHHSNHTTWLQTGADVKILKADERGLPDLTDLENQLKSDNGRPLIIGAFSASSNVTGLITPYHRMAGIMHKYNGICVVDFAASAPYVNMNMHPEKTDEYLDAIIFAPHKFLGGPGTCGVLVMNKALHTGSPSIIGGGNVKWTLPTGELGITPDPEQQEDSGTPAYLQVIKTALALSLKEKMGTENIAQREKFLINRTISHFSQLGEIEMLECNHDLPKIGVVSFNINKMHYNLVVRLLNDRFGIQTRGGWSCASNYAYHLFGFGLDQSSGLINGMKKGDLTGKPGWVRLSLHPTLSNKELDYILDAITQIVYNREKWSAEYRYDCSDNEYYPLDKSLPIPDNSQFFKF